MNDMQKTVGLSELLFNKVIISVSSLISDLTIFGNTVDLVQIQISTISHFHLCAKRIVVEGCESDGSVWNVVKTVFAKVLYVCNAVIPHYLQSFVYFLISLCLGLNEKWTES